MLPKQIMPLNETMQKLGLTSLVDKDINKQQAQAERRQVQESKERVPAKTAEQLKEAKRIMKARKDRAAQVREQRMEKKLAVYETRLQRIERTAKKQSKKVESRLRFIKGLKKRASVMESYDVRKPLGGKDPSGKELAESFMKVAGLAGTLGRAFGCMEQFFGEAEADMGIPVMHAGSAYGYDTDNSNAGSGTYVGGDAVDQGTNKANEDDEAAPKDDMDEAEDKNPLDKDLGEDEEDDDKKDDVKTEEDDCADDKEMKEDDGDDAGEKKDAKDDEKDMELGEDEEADADAEDDTKKKVEAKKRKARAESRALRMPMDFELHQIRLEAEDMASQVGGAGENVNMGYASELMNDMVSYLGGAMKLYFKLQNSMQKMGYVGQDMPAAAVGAPVPTKNPNDAYIGTATKPDGETAVDQGGTANAPKTGDATDTAGVKEPKAESKK